MEPSVTSLSGQVRMPAEWELHERTWMAWPPVGYLTEGGTDAAYRSWAEVANAIVEFEPVTMVVDPTDIGIAKQWLNDQVAIVSGPLKIGRAHV
jgi:agmatine deiminase